MRSFSIREATVWLRLTPSPVRARERVPAIAIRLDSEATDEDIAACTAALDDAPVIAVGVSPLAPEVRLSPLVDALDLTYAPATGDRRIITTTDPDAALAELDDAVSRNPEASLVLAQVLRASAHTTRRQAIDIESLGYSTLLGGREFAAWLAQRGPARAVPVVPDPVLTERTGCLLSITLNRPDRRNAYGVQVRDGLAEALAVALIDDTVRAVELRGNGTVFCAGGDLAEFGFTPDAVTAHVVRTQAGVARSMVALADRTAVFVRGACIGAGIEVPAFAHRVVADAATVFRLPEVSMGLIPGAGGTASIPARIGRWRTMHFGATNAIVTASVALEWGLIDEISAEPEL